MTEEAKKIIEQHMRSDEIILSVSMTADFKTNNREMRKLNRLFEKTSKNMELAREVYLVLLKSENVVTLLNASAECLKLGIYSATALKTLENIAARTDIGIISFNAKMTLEQYEGAE